MKQHDPASADSGASVTQRPLRLLFVTHSFPPAHRPLANVGGMQRVATELHHYLGERDDVRLSTLALRTSARWSALRTILFFPKVWRTIRRRARREEVDAILFSSLVTGSLMVLTRRSFRKWKAKTCTICHGDDVISDSKLYQRLLPRVFKSLDIVFPISRATSQCCIERGAGAAQLHVVPNGVDLTRFEHANDLRLERRQLCQSLASAGEIELPEDALLLCSAGRHVERKGFLWFTRHVMPHLPNSVHYWIVGQGPQTDAIRAAIDEHQLHDRVRLLGRLDEDDLHRVYANADLFIMPNIPVPGTMEGFGVVMLEAGACGTPSIAARLEGIQDVITENENGHLVESGDVAAWVEQVTRYAEDRGALRDLSARTIEKTREFSWSHVAARYIAEIRSAS